MFWLEDGAEADAEVAAALKRIGSLGRLEVRREPPGWETAWQRFHKPHVIGRLYVRPPWYPARDDLLDIAVEAGLAFGTGGHASTRQCLELIQTLAPGSLLDLGSGSGVVSFAALRLGFEPGDRHRDRPRRRARGRRQRGHERPASRRSSSATRPTRRTRCRPPTSWWPTSRSARSCGWRSAGKTADGSRLPPPARPAALGAARRAGRRGARGLPAASPRRRAWTTAPGSRCTSRGAHDGRPRGAAEDRGPAAASAAGPSPPRVAAGFVGCKVSQADGEEALAGLAAAGLEPVTSREAADVVVVHTCCVTAEAERKSRRLVRRAASAGRRVVVAGCAAALRPEQFEGEGVTVAARPDWARLARRPADGCRSRTQSRRGEAVCLAGGRATSGAGSGASESDAASSADSARGSDPRPTSPLPGGRRHVARGAAGDAGSAHAARAQGAGRVRRRVHLLRGAARARRAQKHARWTRRWRRREPGSSAAAARSCSAASTSAPGGTTTRRGAPGAGGARLPDLVAAVAALDGLRRVRLSSIEPRHVTPALLGAARAPARGAPPARAAAVGRRRGAARHEAAVHVREVPAGGRGSARRARRGYAQHRRDRRVPDRGRGGVRAHAGGAGERPLRARARLCVLAAAGDGGGGAAAPAGRGGQGAHGARAGGRRGGRPRRAPRRARPRGGGARGGAARRPLEGVQFGVHPLRAARARPARRAGHGRGRRGRRRRRSPGPSRSEHEPTASSAGSPRGRSPRSW